eukprot:scaffold237983_cov17-Tisochrysis_lutea.AAC.1
MANIRCCAAAMQLKLYESGVAAVARRCSKNQVVQLHESRVVQSYVAKRTTLSNEASEREAHMPGAVQQHCNLSNVTPKLVCCGLRCNEECTCREPSSNVAAQATKSENVSDGSHSRASPSACACQQTHLQAHPSSRKKWWSASPLSGG